MFKKILTGAIILAVCATGANAQVYRWTDSQGRQHVTDAPPPRTAKESEYFDLRQKDENQNRRPMKRKKRPSKNFAYQPVMFYSTPNCGQSCDEVRRLLTERGVPFNEKVIKDELDEEWLFKQVGEKTVPSVTVGHKVQKGFDPDYLNKVLDNAGFPKKVAMPENKDPAALDVKAQNIKKILPNEKPPEIAPDSSELVIDKVGE